MMEPGVIGSERSLNLGRSLADQLKKL